MVDFAKRGAARRDAPIVELAKIMANANVMKDLRASFVSERPAQIIATAVVTALLVHASAVLDGRVLGVLQEVVRTTAVVWVFVKLAFAHASTAIRAPTVRQNHAPVGLVATVLWHGICKDAVCSCTGRHEDPFDEVSCFLGGNSL